MTLGEYITQYRQEHNLSLRGFARAAELSPTYVSYIEKGATHRGNNPLPSIETYRAVAKGCGITVDELIRLVDDTVAINISDDEANDFSTIYRALNRANLSIAEIAQLQSLLSDKLKKALEVK